MCSCPFGWLVVAWYLSCNKKEVFYSESSKLSSCELANQGHYQATSFSLSSLFPRSTATFPRSLGYSSRRGNVPLLACHPIIG